MNDWLQEIYGTNGVNDDQFQKTAQAQMLAKFAEAEGWDLSGLSEEQLQTVADELEQQVGADQQGQQQFEAAPGGVGDEEAEKIAMAKFAEADFLGRTMAHSYVQELRKIAEAEAAKEENPFPPKKKEKEDDEEKTAGPLTRAIQNLQGAPTEEQVKEAALIMQRAGWTFE